MRYSKQRHNESNGKDEKQNKKWYIVIAIAVLAVIGNIISLVVIFSGGGQSGAATNGEVGGNLGGAEYVSEADGDSQSSAEASDDPLAAILDEIEPIIATRHDNGSFSVPRSALTDNLNYINCGGMSLLARATSNGSVRTALNICIDHFAEGTAFFYLVSETTLANNACDCVSLLYNMGLNVWGGCIPVSIPAEYRDDTGDEVVFPYNLMVYIEEMFASWAMGDFEVSLENYVPSSDGSNANNLGYPTDNIALSRNNDGSLAIPKSVLTSAINYIDFGDDVFLLARIDGNGVARTAFNTCRDHYSSQTAFYYLVGASTLANNACSCVMLLSNLGINSWRECEPVSIPPEYRTDTDDEIVIPNELFTFAEEMFSQWAVENYELSLENYIPSAG